jgi:hypothetical protein
MREFEKQKSQGKAVEATVNSKEENSQNFVWISFNNSASGRIWKLYIRLSNIKKLQIWDVATV